MKCTNWVATKQLKRGPRVQFLATADAPKEIANEAFGERDTIRNPLSDLRRCGGPIHARLEAVDESTFGGHHASLEFEFVCDVCKTSVYDTRLPNRYTLADFLTKLMETWEPE